MSDEALGLASKAHIHHPYRLWTNRHYLNGVVEINKLEESDAVLEYVIEGVMEDIKSRLITENIFAYDLWTDMSKVPTLIRRATTYGTVASLYAQTISEEQGTQERAMDYWESRMEKVMQLYLSSQQLRMIVVDIEDEMWRMSDEEWRERFQIL